jgi:hypothetical protein
MDYYDIILVKYSYIRSELKMKKNIVYLLLLVAVLTITGCQKSEKNNLEVKYQDYSDEVIGNNYTYRFIGQSEHFYFKTGKVYFGEGERQFVVTNLKVKDNVEKDTNYSLNIYFNDNLLVGDDYQFGGLTKEKFENQKLSESGKEPKKDANGNSIGESDAFFETSKEDFKDALKVVGYYCVKEKCEKEIFKVTYLDD